MFFDIKLDMTIAMACYFAAFFAAKHIRPLHILFAFTGFGLDMYATYLMETMRMNAGNTLPHVSLLPFHTAVSLLAIIAFFVQMTLGILRKRNAHVISAKYFFLPIWCIAYLSGIYLLSG